MKLAQALQERADLNRRIEQLNTRLINNATVQEGEKTAEDPAQLMAELDGCIARLETLIGQINLTNSKTVVDGLTLTEWIARRDALKVRIEAWRSLVNAASQLARRAARTEIKILSAVDVPQLQKQLDDACAEMRRVDDRIQETNWMTEL
ncbi:MAG: hypothetical protein E7319_04475 [Clostridiales bacterium]|nr:hypothetical protein [Clostridiales bacterium]